MVISKRVIEPNNFLCSLVDLLVQLLARKPESKKVADPQHSKIQQIEKEISTIKEELKHLKSRSLAVS